MKQGKKLMDEYWAYRKRMNKGSLKGRIVLGVIGIGTILAALAAWLYSWAG